mgnify:CR=1 FL=1
MLNSEKAPRGASAHSVLFIVAIASTMIFAGQTRAQSSEALSSTTIEYINTLVSKHYLFPIKSEGKSIDDILRPLDSASQYISPAKFAESRSDQPRTGIGLTLISFPEGPIILSVSRGSPSEGAGLHPGDLIISIDGQQTAGRPINEITRQISGEENTSVQLTTIRRREKYSFNVSRSHWPRISAEVRRIGATAYVRIEEFDEHTIDLIVGGIKNLRHDKSKMNGLVIDLRDCPGGLISEAIMTTDLFIDDGLIFIESDRDPKYTEKYFARRGDIASGLPVEVLINARSSSAAELVAGVLQERGRATVVGMPSFGSGLVQTVIPLNDWRDGALRLTTSAMYLPSGRPLQKIGVRPDIVVANGPEDLDHQVREVDIAGAVDAPSLGPPFPPLKAMSPPDLPPVGYHSDTGDYQLDRALSLISQ